LSIPLFRSPHSISPTGRFRRAFSVYSATAVIPARPRCCGREQEQESVTRHISCHCFAAPPVRALFRTLDFLRQRYDRGRSNFQLGGDVEQHAPLTSELFDCRSGGCTVPSSCPRLASTRPPPPHSHTRPYGVSTPIRILRRHFGQFPFIVCHFLSLYSLVLRTLHMV